MIFNFNRVFFDKILKDGVYPQTIHIFHHYFKDENAYLKEFIRFAQNKGYVIRGYNYNQKTGEKVVYLSFDDNYETWYEMAQMLKEEGATCTFFINFAPNLMSDGLINAYYNSLGLINGKPIGLDKISDLIQQGFDFGNHGLSHVTFSDLQLSHVKTDLDLNRNFFQRHFEAKLTNVAFPYGSMRYFKKEWIDEISEEFGTIYAGHPLSQTENNDKFVFRSPLYISESFEFNLKIQRISNIKPSLTFGKSLIG
ncbi:polysaccharide deacetylase family protein [Saonia flava]|uniref:polysaccharide deacetylase family protein n=1 Tax=Saonia flava TaxID=523696 RepID=UPI00143B63C3|nr:polysaccharide deacetylase family protein [Saonia flava]